MRLTVRSYASYVILTVTQTLYAYFVEGDVVFVGKRKTFDKRVSTRLGLDPLPSLPPSNLHASRY